MSLNVLLENGKISLHLNVIFVILVAKHVIMEPLNSNVLLAIMELGLNSLNAKLLVLLANIRITLPMSAKLVMPLAKHVLEVLALTVLHAQLQDSITILNVEHSVLMDSLVMSQIINVLLVIKLVTLVMELNQINARHAL